ncbi:hypothetical protein GQ44DRAFT_648163 [Phaeosphaeriaceae sp. PMI808]|nr:hypothetical protein GQ44DRAFT_648163 [Phaeosphaeriaceae sp. PMI808]
MRPNALDAATSLTLGEDARYTDGTSMDNQSSKFSDAQSNRPSTPFGQRTDGTQSTVMAVEEAIHGVKAAVDGAIAWAEKKVDKLASATESTGPYDSPATCAPSDLDVIASGVLPAMPPQEEYVKNVHVQNQHNRDETGTSGKRDGDMSER